MSYVRNLPRHVREMPLDRLTDRFWSRVRADGALDALLALTGGRTQCSADAPQGSTPGAGGLLSSLTVGDTDAVFWRDSESGQRRNAKQGLRDRVKARRHSAAKAAQAQDKLADMAAHSRITDLAVLDHKKAVILAAMERARLRKAS